MRDFDEAACAKAAENVWTSLVGSRFDSVLSEIRTPSQRATTTRVAEIELEAMHRAIALAKQRRNATTVAAGLPSELLAMIFSAAAETWAPLHIRHWMAQAKAEKEKEKPRRYDLGWVTITHVCHSWRTAAIHSPQLWSRLECTEIPPSFTVDILLRSKRLPLELSIHEYILLERKQYDQLATIISSWLCGPTLLRTRKLVLHTSTAIFEDHLHFLQDPVPILEELDLSLDRDTWWPDGMFDLTRDSNLKVLRLSSCYPRWEAPLIPRNITSLHLEGGWCDEEVDTSHHPSIPEFSQLLASLSRLERLSLSDIYPVRDHGPEHVEVTHLPATLKHLELSCAWAQHFRDFHPDFWRYFKFPSTCVIVSKISADDWDNVFQQGDGGIFQPIFELNSQAIPALELYVSATDISVRLSLEANRDYWTWRWQDERSGRDIWKDSNLYIDATGGSRHVYSCATSFNLVHFLDDRFPLKSIRALHLSCNAQRALNSSADWLSSFLANCLQVERLSISFTDSSTLLYALSLPDVDHTEADAHGAFKLLPLLKVLVLHARDTLPVRDNTVTDKNRAARNLSFMYLLDARRGAGCPIEELLVDRALESWDIWAKVSKVTTISYFD